MPTYRHAGLTFDYRDAGAGEPVVLLHGFPEDAACWDRVVPLLHQADLRTITPDQRGYSPGATPKRRRDYTIDRLTGDVVALLDHLGLERAHIVGHDWGGGVAWSLAMMYPERVASLVALATPHPAAMVWSLTRSTQGLRSYYMLLFQLPWLPERLSARSMERMLGASGLDAGEARRYALRYADPTRLTGPLNWYRALPFSGRMPDPMVTVPTTYLWGRRDGFLGPEAATKTGDFVAGDYTFVEVDATHWLPENDPEDVADAIIARVRSTGTKDT